MGLQIILSFSYIHFAHINVRPFLNTFDYFRQHVYGNDYHMIGITESWLHLNTRLHESPE